MNENSPKKILVVDDNARVLKLLELRLTQQGFQVFAAERVKDAVVSAIVIKPDLVISEISLPDLKGIEFKRILRSIPAMMEVPIIFISSDSSLPEEFNIEPGAPTDHIQKPYTFEALLEKIQSSLRIATFRRDALNQSDRQSGVLHEMTLTDILQVLAMNKRSCTINLKLGGTDTGKIYFQSGRIVDAKVPGLRGEEALYRLMSWRGADYSIGDEPDDSFDETITQPTRLLIAEGLRRMAAQESKPDQQASDLDSEDLEKVSDQLEEVDSGAAIAKDPQSEEKEFLRGLVEQGVLKEKGM